MDVGIALYTMVAVLTSAAILVSGWNNYSVDRWFVVLLAWLGGVAWPITWFIVIVAFIALAVVS